MIDEKKYKLLCQILNDILIEDDENESRVAISWLYLVRPHSVFLKNYELIFKKNRMHFFYNCLNLFLSNFKKILINFIKSFNSKIKIKKINCDNLFISHIVSNDNFNPQQDFYFNDIPVRLNKLGYSYHYIYFNHSNYIQKNSENTLSLFPTRLFFWQETRLILNALVESSQLLYKCFTSQGLKRRILFCAAVNCLSINTISNLRINYYFKLVLKNSKIKNVFITFEGHAWERLIIINCKINKIKLFAYQHSLLFHLQNSIFINFKSKFKPDFIFTTGLYSNTIFNNFGNDEIKIINLGTNRTNEIGSLENITSNKFNILVIPEGIDEECHILFNFCLKLLNINKNINFIWRFHPISNIEFFIKKFNVSKIDNITISKGSFENDISLSNYVLYRGSTAIIKCVNFGLRPIYLKIKNEISIDPLHNYTSKWKINISNEKELNIILSDRTIIQDKTKKDFISSIQDLYSPLYFNNLLTIFKNYNE